MKSPKQFYHWCSRLGFRPEGRRYSKKKIPYFKGKNRRWRLNCNFEFEVSCREDDFDRWANSRIAGFSMTDIKTFAEFKEHCISILEIDMISYNGRFDD